MSDNCSMPPEDRVMLIVNDNIIRGSIRMQKYGFVIFRQYKLELAEIGIAFPGFGFYDDWIPYHYGPYSRALASDVETAIEAGILTRSGPPPGKMYHEYVLTPRGRVKWHELHEVISDEIATIGKKIKQLQSLRFYELLRRVYAAYPEYITIGKTSPPGSDLNGDGVTGPGGEPHDRSSRSPVS